MAKPETKSKSITANSAVDSLLPITVIRVVAPKFVLWFSRWLWTVPVFGTLAECWRFRSTPCWSRFAKRRKACLDCARRLAPETVELDEFWSFVGKKKNQRWTWLGLTSSTRRIGAIVNGRGTDKNCRQLLESYQNSQLGEFASDEWQSYPKSVPPALHYIGKDKTQRIERANLNFRIHLKRLGRRTIAFSKNDEMHDAVINLYVHYHNLRQHKFWNTTKL